MKIVYCIDQLYTHGGVEKVLSQKANYLADEYNYEVIIITASQNGKKNVYDFSEKIKFIDLGINYTSKSFYSLENLSKATTHFNTLKKFLEALLPDVVINCNTTPDSIFLPFMIKKIPKVKEFHTTRSINAKKSFKQILFDKISYFSEKNYNRIVILNEDEKKFYQSKNITIIPNPTEITPDLKVDLNSKKIIAAGRICFQKNFEDLVKISSLMQKEFSDWQIDIYGDDYGTMSSVKFLIKSYNVQDKIFIKKSVPNLKLKMCEYSIYALTSHHETFPMVLLEALSVGLPVVSYDCATGPNRIITNKVDGFLANYMDVDDFFSKLSVLMKDIDKRQEMSKNALQNSKRFDIKNVMLMWQNLFLNLQNV